METAELHHRLLPGSRSLLGAQDRCSPHVTALVPELIQLFKILSREVPSEPQASAEECAILLTDLQRCLGTTLEEGFPQKRAEALPTFICLGMTGMPAGVVRLAGRVWVALRVLGRLISAATAEEKLRPIIGFPAVWCGVDLIKNMRVVRPDSMPPSAAMKEFTGALAAATANKPAPHAPVEACPCCEAYHTWHSCLLSASAELAVLSTAAVEYRTLPKAVAVAFAAAARAHDACSEKRSHTELALLCSTARLFSLTPTIAHRAALPASEVKRMLWGIDIEPVMCAHIHAVLRLRMLLFSKKGSEKEGSDDGEESTTSLVNLDSKGAQLDWLKAVLSSLLAFLEAGMQLDMFMRAEGIDLLLWLFLVYTDSERPAGVGQLEHKFEEVLLVAAQCLVAVLSSSGREEAQQQFMTASGFQRLLDIVDALPLRRLLDTFLLDGRHTLWQLQCVSMKVLELATLECSDGMAKFFEQAGILSLVKAARLHPDKPVVCPVSDHYKDLPLAQEQEAGVKDLLASVAAHAFAVVGQVCFSAGKPVGEHQDHPYFVLACISSLEEMEQLVKLGDVRWDRPEGRPWAATLAKNAPFCSLSASLIVCTQGLLGQGVEKREDFMQLKYKELFNTHLGFMQHYGGGDSKMLAKSLAFRVFARLLRERASWRRDLLQRRVHLLAGATLTGAVTSLKHETQAGRKARLHKLQARSRGRAGAGACGCGLPGCTLGDTGGLGEGPAQDAAKATRIVEASSLLTSSLTLLTALQEAGKEGRQAALEVLWNMNLAEAANASPSLASVSADLKGPEASLKEWLAWGEQLVQQSGGKRTAQLDAEKAAEAAAAALLSEEEAVQRKAAAKAAKRQRQKAAKQRAGAAQQPEEPSGAPLDSAQVERQEGAITDTPVAAGESSGSANPRGEHVASLTQGAPRQPIDTAASSPASQAVELTNAAQSSEEGAEDTVPRQACSRSGSQQQVLLSSPYNEQASGSQEVPVGGTAARAVKLKKPQKAVEREQQRSPPPRNASLQESAAGLLRAAPAGNEQASPAIIPALAAILGPAAPTHPASKRAAAIAAPATPPRAAPPALPPPLSVEIPLLSPAPLLGAVPLPSATSGEAPAAAVAARSGEPVASEAPDTVAAAQAAEAQVAQYQALLEYLLPGISVSEPQTRPTSHEPAAPASNGSLSASSLGRNSVPIEASSNEQQGQGQQQAFHPTAVGSVCSSGGGNKVPPTLEAVLVCRLSGRLLSDPVIAADGFTYEREALTAWLQHGKLHSPATGRPLSSGAVRPNFAVRDLLSALWVC